MSFQDSNQAQTTGPEMDTEIQEALQEELDDYTLALAIVGTHRTYKVTPEREEAVTIDIQEELDLRDTLRMANQSRYDKLELVVHSPGGSVRSSYKVARMLRRNFSHIRVFVPHLALSGGTLIALTGNKIVMGEMSNLTPIDVQLPYDGQMRSVNSMRRSFEFLDNFFRKHSEEEAPHPWVALADKFDPVIFQEWRDASDLMRYYAEEILSHKDATFNEDQAEQIVYALATSEVFPTHEYAVMREELQAIIDVLDTDSDYIVASNEYPRLWEIMEAWQEKYTEVNATSHVFRFVSTREMNNEDHQLREYSGGSDNTNSESDPTGEG